MMRYGLVGFMFVVLGGLFIAPTVHAQAGLAAASSLPGVLVGAGSASQTAGAVLGAYRTLRRFYRERQDTPAWVGSVGAAQLEGLVNAISASDAHGLQPGDYHLDALRAAIERRDTVAVDLLATDAYLMLGAHLSGGKVDPVTIEPNWTAHGRRRDLAAHLARALAEGRVVESLAALEPGAAEYQVLKAHLAVYRRARAEGGWEVVPPGPPLKAGDGGPRVAMLHRRLQATGLADPARAVSDVFDASLEAAVAAFQRRIGLEADGVVGATTLRELNRSAAERVDQLRANLERWRWLPDDLGRRHIRVNIADFRLEARADGAIERVHDVVVGRPYRKTPVFSGRIDYVVLNPWWETPSRLARLDKLPAFRADPSAVQRLGFQVLDADGRRLDPAAIDWRAYSATDFPLRLRQQPGPLNALGQVKMMFPNAHNVYLHDTPSRDLFDRSQRAFSSGCVRVADALGLAGWLLSGAGAATGDDVDRIVASGRETRIDLPQGVPVHLLYLTAVVDPDGSLRLVNDVYERDARLIAALGRSSDQAAPQ